MKSVQTKILVLILGCILISAAALGGAGFYYAGTAVEEDSAQIMKLLCSQKAQEIDKHIQNIEQSVNTLYYYIDRQLELDRLEKDKKYQDQAIANMRDLSLNAAENTEGAVAVYFRLNPEIASSVTGIFLTKSSRDGQFEDHEVTDLSKYEPDDVEHVGWYYIPIENGKATWMEPYDNKNVDIQMISYVIPIFQDGKTIGVVGMDIDMELLKETVDSVKVYENGYAFLLDAKGNIIYHKDYPDGVGQKQVDKDINGVQELLAKKNHADIIYKYERNGQKRKMVLHRLKNNLTMAVTVPAEEIDAPRNRLLVQLILSLLIILVIAVFLTVRVTRMMIRPLKQLTLAAQKVADGDLEVNIECESKDEIGVLAKSFSKTTKHLKKYLNYINSLAYIDALTGTQNKTAYTERTEHLELAVKNGEAVFLTAVFDINDLKKMNDTYGHEYGDMLIKDAAKLLQSCFGKSSVFRIGGDEFSVILEGEEAGKYTSFAEQFKAELQNFNRENTRYHQRLQIAFGAAVYHAETDVSYHDVFRRADKLMYENKQMLKGQETEKRMS